MKARHLCSVMKTLTRWGRSKPMEGIIVNPVRYLVADELIYINGKVLNNQKILRGELKIRDRERLEAAVARPASSAFGEDAYKTLQDKVSAMMHSVARNHPFTDGNKRTATIATVFMLAVNGYDVDWVADDALNIILQLAQGTIDMPHFSAWLPLKVGHPAITPDSNRDMEHIDTLITQHQWLLDELSER